MSRLAIAYLFISLTLCYSQPQQCFFHWFHLESVCVGLLKWSPSDISFNRITGRFLFDQCSNCSHIMIMQVCWCHNKGIVQWAVCGLETCCIWYFYLIMGVDTGVLELQQSHSNCTSSNSLSLLDFFVVPNYTMTCQILESFFFTLLVFLVCFNANITSPNSITPVTNIKFQLSP